VKTRLQLATLVLILVGVGSGMVLYKHFALGFPLFASETQDVWQIETRLSFDVTDGPVEARLNMPDPVSSRKTVSRQSLAPGYEFAIKDENGRQFAVWSREKAPAGREQLVLYSELFFAENPQYTEESAPELTLPEFSRTEAEAMKAIDSYLQEDDLRGRQLVKVVLKALNNPTSDMWVVLSRDKSLLSERLNLAIDILARQGLVATSYKGVILEDRQRKRKLKSILAVYMEGQWIAFDPGAAEQIPGDRFLPYQSGSEALFEVTGGENSSLDYSVIKVQRAKFINAVEDARQNRSWLVDFSIYSLPIDQQNTFKLLLLIPLGALVVVVLRNLVGIRTSGTFMPILIAMAFLQTTLLTGLILFLIVVSVGLFVRSYLTHLNLLLVPRIASVLVFVILIYAAIVIASHKLGLAWGMKVTFFPMIILSWTIERMSILWDEDGPKEVLIQGSGSLLTASLAYLVMSQDTVADSIFLYPEALLILLAIIIAIGSYSGYRLSDLRRFEPMERY
jgi:hypothetical protein